MAYPIVRLSLKAGLVPIWDATGSSDGPMGGWMSHDRMSDVACPVRQPQ